ncbi:hypothetical protein D3C73_1415420 [compost metagenome]
MLGCNGLLFEHCVGIAILYGEVFNIAVDSRNLDVQLLVFIFGVEHEGAAACSVAVVEMDVFIILVQIDRFVRVFGVVRRIESGGDGNAFELFP